MSARILQSIQEQRWLAMQLTAENQAEVAVWCGGVCYEDSVCEIPGSLWGPVQLEAEPGDWVISRGDGFYFVRSDEKMREEFFEVEA